MKELDLRHQQNFFFLVLIIQFVAVVIVIVSDIAGIIVEQLFDWTWRKTVYVDLAAQRLDIHWIIQ